METDDEAYQWIFNRIVTPAVNFFKPTVVVDVVGADTHKNDPLSNLSLTNEGMSDVMKIIRDYCHHLLLLGGGGYDLYSTSRAWCRIWAAANQIDALPDYLLTLGGSFIGGEGLAGGEIVDRAFRISGEKKNKILAELKEIAEYHERHTLPII